MSGRRTRIAVIGYGPIARRHIGLIEEIKGRENIEMLVCRNRPLPLRPEHSWITATDKFKDALDFAPDCAVIASPATKHAEQALALAGRGAHMLIEKPLAASPDGLEELESVCAARGLTALVGYDMTYLPHLEYFVGAIRSNAVGTLVSVQAEVGQFLPEWRPGSDYRETVSAKAELGGGVILELSHEIEYADRLLGGSRAVLCSARKSGLLDIDTEDTADIILEGENGATASIHMNMLQGAPTRSCRAVGTEGALTLDLIAGSVYRLRGGGAPPVLEFQESGRDAAAPYREQMRSFFACVAGESVPRVTLGRGRRVVQIASAARESAREGVKVIVR